MGRHLPRARPPLIEQPIGRRYCPVADREMAPPTRYARSDEASIAYQVVGEGSVDLLFLPGWISQVEHAWELPGLRRFFERLSAFSRLILFDRRGTGLSERVVVAPTLEEDTRDALAVLDAAGSERAALFTYGVAGPTGVMLATAHPERVSALVLYASVARTTRAPGYEWAPTVEQRSETIESMTEAWGQHSPLAALAPSVADDPATVEWFARLERLAASPGTARVMSLATNNLDVRDMLSSIAVPTLVLHRPRESLWDVRHSRYLAEHIPGARLVELAGQDSYPWMDDAEALVEEIEEFLTGERTAEERQRALLSVMFTDIVDATARAGQLGDRGWRDLLARHDEVVRGELARYGGREVKTIGDGFLATFAGPPSQALRCARAITSGADGLGVGVRIGVHTGECELIAEDVGGMAVHIASRVMSLAQAGEVLVSGTVYGTVVGGPFSFEDRGYHRLRGVPGQWPLFCLRG
jgi:class 3 adenylate cyclase